MNRLIKGFSGVLTLMLAMTLGLGPALAQSGQDELGQVQRMLDSGDNWQALKKLDAMVKKDAQNKDARFMRGIVLVQVNRAADAIEVFSQLTKDFPQLPEPYNNLAVLYAQEGQYENAKNALQSAIKTHPSYATAHENLGDIYSTLARQAYNRALELDGANDAARVKLAMLDRIVSPAAGAQAGQQVTGTPPRDNSSSTPPVASTYPVAAPAASTTAGGLPDRQAVLGAVQNWSRAWANQNVEGYLNSYSPDFNPPDNLSLRKWQAGRRDRLRRPGSIQLTINSPEVQMPDPFTAEVTFRQLYSSDNYSDTVQKRLTLHKLNGRWLILREDVL